MKFVLFATLVSAALAAPAVAQNQDPSQFPKIMQERMLSGVKQGISKAFDTIDANKDGRLVQSELTAFARARGFGDGKVLDGGSWARSDKNRDGSISRGEFVETMMAGYMSIAAPKR